MEILKCVNVNKTYGKGENEVNALKNVNLSINKGELISIIGPSGSGKSTLLHILGGVDKATSGDILIEGVNISNYSEKQLAHYRRRKVGLIYQFYNLIPNLTVKNNILLPLKLDGKKVDEDYFNELIEKLNLKDKLNAFPNELSGGQMQRVAIIRALIYKPSVILADEPTGNLDKENSKQIVEILKYMNRTYKQTVIIITHDEKVALSTRRIIKIEDGMITGDDINE